MQTSPGLCLEIVYQSSRGADEVLIFLHQSYKLLSPINCFHGNNAFGLDGDPEKFLMGFLKMCRKQVGGRGGALKHPQNRSSLSSTNMCC